MYLRDSTRINDLYLRLAREERSDPDVAQKVLHYHMMRTELPLSYHGIEGIGLLGSMPKIARKAWRSDVEAGFRGQLVAKPCSVPQTSGFTVPGAIVNGVERQYGLRKHLCLNPHILSSYRPVRGVEILRTEPQTAEKYGLPGPAIKQDLRLLDTGWFRHATL